MLFPGCSGHTSVIEDAPLVALVRGVRSVTASRPVSLPTGLACVCMYHGPVQLVALPSLA